MSLSRICVLVALAACAAGLPKPPAPPRTTKLDLEFTSLTLSSGLRVVLVHDPRATEVGVTMRYQVGAVDAPADQPGLAHLVEHLMFQQVLGAESLFARLERVATSFNAYTTYDATTYVSRAAPSHLDDLLAVEAVRVGFRCQTITDSAFLREREVVANELAQQGEVDELLAAIHAGAFPAGHPYARALGGTVDVIRAATREQACAFADAHYAPGNAVLVVSGNVTVPQLKSSLTKFLGRVTRRDATPPVAIPSIGDEPPRHVELKLPIDDEAVLIAWPLPSDPARRIRVRAIEPMVRIAIDNAVRGRVVAVSLGDERAPMTGVVVFPASDETVEQVIAAARGAVEQVPNTIAWRGGTIEVGELAFDRMQQSAIYRLYASLEGGSDRDTRIAAYVLAGLDPDVAVAAELSGLGEMTRASAVSIARADLAFDGATILRLEPDGAKKKGHPAELQAAIHDLGRRRDLPDPAAAHQPAPAADTPELGAIRTRRLPNGLSVVLVPLTSVPAVDIRMVFAAGTADEPPDRRGAALVAGYGLTWDYHYLNDLLLFSAAGGADHAEVHRDDTAFVAEGLAMHLDVLLAGLRRWVREGRYPAGVRAVVAAMRREAKAVDDDGALTDAWRTALYGASHAYVEAGLVRHTGERLTSDDAAAFRRDHYTPDNATLVIAGQFDVALADRWIDYLFGDWTGHATARASVRAAPQPASIAKAEDTSQVYVSIALPASAAGRAAHLVAAEMLADLAGDVRHQLGASYGLATAFDESRLATSFSVSGSIDASRARDAVELLHRRLDALRADPDATASAFVAARARVLTRAASITGSAASLAERTEHDLDLGRAPLAGADVQQLRIDDMTATLAELDLARAAILMRGPKADVDAAFAALGRTPTYIQVARVAAPPAEAATEHDDDPIVHLGDVEAAITQRDTSHVEYAIGTGYLTGTINDSSPSSGAIVTGEVGAVSSNAVFGVHASIARLSGSYDVGDLLPILKPISVIPIEVMGVVRTTTANRFWIGLLAGVHLDRVTTTSSTWQVAAGLGLEGGVDAVVLGSHRIGLYGQIETEVPDAALVAFTLGLAYRR